MITDYFIVALSLFFIELLYFRIADKANIIDKPNERSSHSQVTLRGGGIIFCIGGISYFIISGFQYPYFFGGLISIAIVSFIDDVDSLPNKIRITVHLISVLLLCFQVHLFVHSFLWLIPVIIVAIGVINAYNFMDGINGITASYSLAVLGLLAYVNGELQFADERLIMYSIIAVLVFAFFNFRQKAICFAGDVGSVSMAFIILFLLMLLVIKSGDPIFILFLSIYGIDSIWTIVHRLIKKENIFRAHRSHLYQYLSNEAQINKLIVSFGYGITQLLIGLLVIHFSQKSEVIQITFSLFLLLLLSVVYWITKMQLIKKHNL